MKIQRLNGKLILALITISFTGLAEAHGRERPEMSAETKEAMKACLSEAGVQAENGRLRLNDDQRSQVKSCLEGKGIQMPERPAGKPQRGDKQGNSKMEEMKACLEGKGVELPKPEYGKKPVIDESVREAIKACRESIEGNQESATEDSSNNASTVSSAL